MQLFNNKGVYDFFFFFYCLIYDFFTFLGFSNLDIKRKNLKNEEITIYNNLYYSNLKDNLLNLIFNNNFFKLDFFVLLINKSKYSKYFYKNKIFRSYFRTLNTSNGFYFNFLNFNKKNNFLFFLKNSLFAGFKFL
jgi:hypothetical protein